MRPMKASISHADAEILLEVDLAKLMVCVNGNEHTPKDVPMAELLYLLMEVHPDILTYGRIEQDFLQKHEIEEHSARQYLRKKCSSLHGQLRIWTGLPDVITNVRKVGYRFCDGWVRNGDEKIDSQGGVPQVVDCLRELKDLIAKTIDLAEQLPMAVRDIEEGEGSKLLVLNSESREQEIKELSDAFRSTGDCLFNLLKLSPMDERHMRLQSTLATMHSYVTMSRQGADITEEIWRRLFREELNSHYQLVVFLATGGLL